MSIAYDILHGHTDAPCPRCTYPVWIRLSEVMAQTTVLCPCCRTLIALREDRGSLRTAAAEISSALRSIER
jgi:hypothetical protein